REAESDAPAPAAVPLPNTDNTRVDRPRCYVLTLSFTIPANGTATEMGRQLALQQTALNAKNPCQAAADIAQYPVNRPIGERERPRARERYIQADAARIRSLNPSLSANAALDMARTAATGKDAIHTLDMVAGGNPMVFSRLGGRSENRSIGGQWGSGGKVTELATYAKDQCNNGCPSMQTALIAS
ncbi:polymorphic toxin type 15 domain-containing protein, partial [Roseinatronobacter alkalisoli]